MVISILTEKDEQLWDEYISKKEEANIFHTTEWKRAIEKTHGYKPIYFISRERNGVNGILPLFLIKGLLGKKKLCANPFSYYSELIFDNRVIGKEIIEKAISWAKDNNIDFIELKPVNKLDKDIISSFGFLEKKPFVITRLRLPENKAELNQIYDKRLVKNLRTLTRNFEKEGFEIRFMKKIKDLQDYHNIMVREFRDKHMMICQPYTLLKRMYEEMHSKKKMYLLVVEKDGKILGGMILLTFNKHIVYFMGSSNQKYLRYSLSTLLVDYAIRWCCEQDYKYFDFGPSSHSQRGVIYFKERWGSKSTDLYYYYKLIISKKAPNPIDFENSYKVIRSVYKHIPIPFIKRMLPIVVKYLE